MKLCQHGFSSTHPLENRPGYCSGPFDLGIAPLVQLIGDETCSYCKKLTECLSLPEDGETPRSACRDCIVAAFAEYWEG